MIHQLLTSWTFCCWMESALALMLRICSGRSSRASRRPGMEKLEINRAVEGTPSEHRP